MGIVFGHESLSPEFAQVKFQEQSQHPWQHCFTYRWFDVFRGEEIASNKSDVVAGTISNFGKLGAGGLQ